MKYIKMFAIAGVALLPVAAWAAEGKSVSAHEQVLIDNSKKLNKNLIASAIMKISCKIVVMA